LKQKAVYANQDPACAVVVTFTFPSSTHALADRSTTTAGMIRILSVVNAFTRGCLLIRSGAVDSPSFRIYPASI